MDSSGSLRDNNPADGSYDNWNLVLSFVSSIVDALDIGENGIRVGLIIYSRNAEHQFYLDTYFNKNDMVSKITSTRYLGSYTNTFEGLQFAHNTQFTVEHGDRPDASNIAIVITDGQSNIDEEQTVPAAEAMHADDIQVISIGVTDAIDVDELRGMSSPPHVENSDWFRSANFNVLDAIKEAIVEEIQSGICPSKCGVWLDYYLYCNVIIYNMSQVK